MGVLRLLGPDQATLLFDFTAPTGTGNPSNVVTKLGAELDLGTISPVLDVDTRTYGVDLIGNSTPAVEMQIPFTASAASDDALWAGLGQLDRYLLSIARDHPLYLEWTELTSTLYYDIIGATSLVQLLRGQTAAGNVALRRSSLGEIPLRLLRQPWARGASVTTSGVTVPNDPATSTKARVYPLTVTGDLPTPGRVRVQMDAGSIERVFLAHRALKSRASTDFSTYLSDTAFSQTESSARGWTVTRSSDTSLPGADATASGGGSSFARTAFTTNPTLMQEKIKFTRTTNMDSLRGSWDIIARVRPSSTNANTFELQAAWAPSAAGNPTETFDPVPFEVQGNVSTVWVEKRLGTIQLPQSVPLSGLQIRFYARQTAGSDDLDWDFLWLPPATNATVVVPGGQSTTWLGSELDNPSGITGDPGWTDGAVVGTAMRLNAANEAAGTLPTTGFDPDDGRHRVTFRVKLNAFVGTWTRRITNETDNTEVLEFTGLDAGSSATVTYTHEYDAVAAKNYLYSVQITAYTSGSIDVLSITDEFIPSITTNESVRTEPGPSRYGADKLDGSGNFAASLSCEGEVPVLLEPGENHLIVRVLDVRAAGFEDNESVLSRTPTVTVAYDPRYAI